MAMQMGISMILILAGTGYIDAILLKNGKLSDLIGDIQHLDTILVVFMLHLLALMKEGLGKNGEGSDSDSSSLTSMNHVVGGLKGDTPHMISAAVKGLARLDYEFFDLLSATYSVLPSALILLKRKNRELIKANLGLLKVLVAKSQADGLQVHLKSIVVGLLVCQDDNKNHFKAKIKLLIEMLIKKCGIDAVKAVTPEENVKLD